MKRLQHERITEYVVLNCFVYESEFRFGNAFLLKFLSSYALNLDRDIDKRNVVVRFFEVEKGWSN